MKNFDPPPGQSTEEREQSEKAGDSSIQVDQLLPLVYSELRQMAHHLMRRERGGHTLQTTALINEAYLRLSRGTGVRPLSREHFLRTAARAMRRVLVDHARNRNYQKRGGRHEHVPIEEVECEGAALFSYPNLELVALDNALDKLQEVDERKVRVVECLYFAGLNQSETAAVLGVARKTVNRDWQVARAWLIQCLETSAGDGGAADRPSI